MQFPPVLPGDTGLFSSALGSSLASSRGAQIYPLDLGERSAIITVTDSNDVLPRLIASLSGGPGAHAGFWKFPRLNIGPSSVSVSADADASLRKEPGRMKDHETNGGKRPMRRAELMGGHTHETQNAVRIQIWMRDEKFLARGRHHREPLFRTLGSDEASASAELRKLMAEVENDTFLRPSDPLAKLRRQKPCVTPLSIVELATEFIAERRRTKGKGTATRYANWLAHVGAFAEQPRVKRQYPHAYGVNREFFVELKIFLGRRPVSPNGKAGAKRRLMAESTIRKTIEALRGMLLWACSASVRRLPADFLLPETSDILGKPKRKNPVRKVVFNLERRRRLVLISDAYQLSTLSLQYIVPLRPEQLAGLLIQEIDWAERVLSFGTRFDGRDFTKGRTDFCIPYPVELEPVLRAAVGRRCDGPVFLTRDVFIRRKRPAIETADLGDMKRAVEAALEDAPSDQLLTDNDAKAICRETFARAGGVTTDGLSREFGKLIGPAGIDGDVCYYDLRGSVVSEMARVGVPTPYLRYVMGHEQTFGGTIDAYASLNMESIRESMQRHWDFCAELLAAIAKRAAYLNTIERERCDDGSAIS